MCAVRRGADWSDDGGGGRKHETPNSFAEKRWRMDSMDWIYNYLYGKRSADSLCHSINRCWRDCVRVIVWKKKLLEFPFVHISKHAKDEEEIGCIFVTQ